MRVLLVEDDEKLGRLIVHKLARDYGFRVEWAKDGEEALAWAQAEPFDIVVLDWRLPGLSGLDVLRSLRKAGFAPPILMLTARDAVDDRVTGLEAGADDYLVKPFAFAELAARLHALLRRPPRWEGDVQAIGGLTIDRRTKTVYWRGNALNLTPREADIVLALARRPGEAVSRDELFVRVWGNEDVTPNVLDQYLARLRRKFESLGEEAPAIETVRGVGYRLREARDGR
ncbi:response regulator transcription factor [Hydrogenibacillus sp. N12]|uniref:response regulator transcription factor n=1 Tax=Hydrogenibacillus sp. N12 TaxID=2866627 RepID=UPI001C7D7B21|nr:response regulator transcription factor [Hydrogenibacillus sp. N12]QZA32254.1 response regulator transcription factor [Hydrogenibacillus sp. N12]